MLRKLLIASLAAGALAAPALGAPPVTLMPGVTYSSGVQFTPHGPVAIRIITAPKPGGLYAFGPVLGRGTIVGGREKVTQIEKDVSATATVAGINGDLFNWSDSHPSGIYMQGGVLWHPPATGRSSIGVDSTGTLRVDRVRFFGTWKGTGQRRPLNGLNETPTAGQVVLFTPQWGAATPNVPGAAEAVIEPLPASIPNADLAGPVTAVSTGPTPIPADGAVLMAAGSTMAKALQAEAPVGTALTTRLILQPDWTGVVGALGGGPVIVRNGGPVFRSFEDFTPDQIQIRDPRAGVGQLADGRIVLVAVDGRRPGYSVGMTTFELAQTLARLGAVTGSAVDSGGSVTVAFDGGLLNRPSDTGGERAVKEALLVQYSGVYAPPPSADVLSPNGDNRDESETLAYKLVRPSTVTADLVGPDGTTIPLDSGLKDPGIYSFTFNGTTAPDVPPVEGRWHWVVTATDDLARPSAIDRGFWLNTTLKGILARPALMRVRKRAGSLAVRFTLLHPARVALRIETSFGTILRTIRVPGTQQPGVAVALWDGRIGASGLIHSGSYVARIIATNEFGTAQLTAPFRVRRV